MRRVVRREAAERIDALAFADVRGLLAGPPIQRDAREHLPVAERPMRRAGRLVREPQIAPAVIERVAVAMTDQRPSPLAHHVKPGELVRPVAAAVDVNAPIIRAHAAAGDLAGAMLAGFLRTPAKFAAVRVVVQELLQPLLRQRGFVHCVLANKKGPQGGPIKICGAAIVLFRGSFDCYIFVGGTGC